MLYIINHKENANQNNELQFHIIKITKNRKKRTETTPTDLE